MSDNRTAQEILQEMREQHELMRMREERELARLRGQEDINRLQQQRAFQAAIVEQEMESRMYSSDPAIMFTDEEISKIKSRILKETIKRKDHFKVEDDLFEI